MRPGLRRRSSAPTESPTSSARRLRPFAENSATSLPQKPSSGRRKLGGDEREGLDDAPAPLARHGIDRSGEGRDRARDLEVGLGEDDGLATVAVVADSRVEWHPAKYRSVDLLRGAGPPPEPKSSSPVPTRCVMFSTTPSSRILVLSAIWAARTATCCAARCGVVTTIASARGRSWPSEIATSPVPGGMSTTSVSSSPQWTSDRNCSSARWSIGPRHMTGWLSSRKKPIDITFRSPRTGGTIILSTTTGRWWMPSMCGIECP